MVCKGQDGHTYAHVPCDLPNGDEPIVDRPDQLTTVIRQIHFPLGGRIAVGKHEDTNRTHTWEQMITVGGGRAKNGYVWEERIV